MTSQSLANGSVIYDFGMNEGLNLDYYLKKGFKVVAVDANPQVCESTRAKFYNFIDSGQLVVINCAISLSDNSELIEFYLHKVHSVLSRLPRPSVEELENFYPILISQKKASSIIKDHGSPHYVKIDLETFDPYVLQDLFENRIVPPYISVEAHEVEVFLRLLQIGYKVFNLVDGPSVFTFYRAHRIKTKDEDEVYSFLRDSAGPFGEDIKTPWLDKKSFMYLLAASSLGWKDIHATTILPPHPDAAITLSDLIPFREHVKAIVPSFLRAVKSRSQKFFS